MTAEREGLAEISGMFDSFYAAGCNPRHEQGQTDECNACTAFTIADALVDLLAARDRRVRAEAVRPLRDGIWALGESIYGEEGVLHNEGCEGEPDCLACIVASLRRLLETTEVEG